MPIERSKVEDILAPDIGRDQVIMAISFVTISGSPVGTRVPAEIGETVFDDSARVFWIATGFTAANWQQMNGAS